MQYVRILQSHSGKHFYTGINTAVDACLADAVNKVQLKRAYDPANEQDESRFFVERLWPRGVAKSALAVAARLRAVVPRPGLREWFHHAPQR